MGHMKIFFVTIPPRRPDLEENNFPTRGFSRASIPRSKVKERKELEKYLDSIKESKMSWNIE